MHKKILLTGGNGFIGKNIQESFLSQKYDITAPRSFELDLTDTAAVDAFFRTHSFDVILHAAAKPGHRNAKDPTRLLYTNLRMFENLVRQEGRFGKLIHFGSGAVYDSSADNRQVTEDQIGTRIGADEHSFCKYVIHQRSQALSNVIHLNIFGIFGKYEDWEIRFISNAICKTLFDLPITLRQNRRFSYLYIDDLMPILDFFITHTPRHNSYNVTPDEETELLHAAKLVQQISGSTREILVEKAGYGLNYSGSNARLKAEMETLCFTPLPQAIKKLYAYYEGYKSQLDVNLLRLNK